MKQAIKLIILLAVIIICVVVVRRTLRQHAFKPRLNEAHALFDEAVTEEELLEAKAAYKKLLQQAPSRDARRIVEGEIASIQANISYMRSDDVHDPEGYADIIEKIERAIDYKGDPDGVWEGKLAQMRGRYKDALGPSLEGMRERFARGKDMPFPQAMQDLEALYRWRARWEEQSRHQDDPERERLFEELYVYLVENHVRQFEESVAAAREIPDGDRTMEGLGQVARPLGMIGMVQHHAPEKAEEFREKYADDFQRAERAQNILAAMQQ